MESENIIGRIQQMSECRPLLLWGAASTGIGLFRALQRLGLTPAGFIDKRRDALPKRICGVPIYLPAEVVDDYMGKRRPIIINTTPLHADSIQRVCLEAGLTEDNDFFTYDKLVPFDFQIIVASSCNLRCISCPVGNRNEGMHTGFMSAADYERILDKILVEVPLVSMVQLYNWGEPFLNRELAHIIAITNDRHVYCSLSSNLSLDMDFRSVVAAKPACIRVSLSGNSVTYSVTHTGGKWELVMKNLQQLHMLREKYHSEMMVEVAYHVYATTSVEDIDTLRRLCRKCGFVFRPHYAAILPLDNVDDYLEDRALSSQALQTIEILSLSVDEAVTQAYREKEYGCSFLRTFCIESDRSVKQCGLWVRPEENCAANDFLTEPLTAIINRRKSNNLCRYCLSKGLHRFCSIYTDKTVTVENVATAAGVL